MHECVRLKISQRNKINDKESSLFQIYPPCQVNLLTMLNPNLLVDYHPMVGKVILDHLSPGITQSHFPEIIQTLSLSFSDMNKDIRKKLSRILVSICQQVHPELVVEQLMRFIQETHVPEIHTGLLKAVMFVLLLFQCEQVNLLALCHEISPLLCTDNFEVTEYSTFLLSLPFRST